MVREPPRGFFLETTKSILIVSSQNIPLGRDLLHGIQALYFYGEPLPQGIRGIKGSVDSLAGGKSGRLAVFSVHLDWGGASAPVDSICRPAEVPPERVGLCAMCHPGHRDGLPGGRRYVEGHLPRGHLSGGKDTDPPEGDHRSASQTGRYRPPQPNLDHGGELDGILRDHGAPCHGAPWD